MFVSTVYPYQPRDASICIPLLSPKIFVPHSDFSGSDQSLLRSVTLALRSTLFAAMLRSSYHSATPLFSLSPPLLFLLLSAPILSVSFFSPLASYTLCFDRIGSALGTLFVSALLGSAQFDPSCSALSFAPLDLLIFLKITYH